MNWFPHCLGMGRALRILDILDILHILDIFDILDILDIWAGSPKLLKYLEYLKYLKYLHSVSGCATAPGEAGKARMYWFPHCLRSPIPYVLVSALFSSRLLGARIPDQRPKDQKSRGLPGFFFPRDP